MAVISELIRTEENGKLSFGDYTLDAKAKLDNFEFQGDIFKGKKFKEITKLERNGMFVYESVPGTAVIISRQQRTVVSLKYVERQIFRLHLELKRRQSTKLI